MIKHICFLIKNKEIEALANTKLILGFSFIGAILAAGLSVATAQGEIQTILYWGLLFYPIVGITSWLLLVAFKMRYYFVANYIIVAMGLVLITFSLLFYLILSLYSILPLKVWLLVTFVMVVINALVWYYNRVNQEKAITGFKKLYKEDKLDLQLYKHGSYMYPTPRWLFWIAVWSYIASIVIMIIGFYINRLGSMNEPFVPYLLAWGITGFTVGLILSSSRWFGDMRAIIKATKELIEEEE